MCDAALPVEVEEFLSLWDLPALSSLDASEAAPQYARKTPDVVAKHELEKAKERKRSQANRAQQRRERETLQRQVKELSAELANRRSTKLVATSAWKIIAQQHLQARLNAESEQRRLIASIDAQSALIQGLKRFLHDNLINAEGLQLEAHGDSYEQQPIRFEQTDVEFYRTYEKELDTTYAETDEALRAAGLDLTSGTEAEQTWRNDDARGCYVFKLRRVVQLNYQKVCEYMLQASMLQHRHENRTQFEGVSNPENTAFKFRIKTRLATGRTVSILQRSVTRCYPEAGRNVVVWRTLTEGEGLFAGLHTDETGWGVSSPLTETSTLLRTCMRFVPIHFGEAPTQIPTAKQYTGLVFRAGTQNSMETTNRLEKLALQGSYYLC